GLSQVELRPPQLVAQARVGCATLLQLRVGAAQHRHQRLERDDGQEALERRLAQGAPGRDREQPGRQHHHEQPAPEQARKLLHADGLYRSAQAFLWCSANAAPCGSPQTTMWSPPGTSIGPLTTCTASDFTAAAFLPTSSTRKYSI